MDINNLLQTMFLVNMKDITKLSYRELFPIILFCLFNSYKKYIIEYLYNFIHEFKTDASFSSQITNEIKISYSTENNDSTTYATETTNAIIWYYKHSQCALKMSDKLKEYQTNLNVERNDDINGRYIHGVYIPSENTTVVLENDIYLEFIHHPTTTASSSPVKYYVDEHGDGGIKNENKLFSTTIIKLVLKSKRKEIDELLNWVKHVNKSYLEWIYTNKKLYIYTSSGSSNNKIIFSQYEYSSTKSFDNLFFGQKELILERLKQYTDINRYKKLGIPHTLGFLFYGEPGCGKTSCIKAIANYLQRHIVSVNLKHVKNIDELRQLFLSDVITGSVVMATPSKRIYVFEELDCSYDNIHNPFIDRSLKRKEEENTTSITSDTDFTVLSTQVDKLTQALLTSVNNNNNTNSKSESKKPINSLELMNEPKISTGEVLELLDGIAETNDRIIIFTTNYPDRIDKAFMRPGRIDVSIEFKRLRVQDMNNLYKLWYDKEIDNEVLCKIKDYSISQAEFGKLCFENDADEVLNKLLMC